MRSSKLAALAYSVPPNSLTHESLQGRFGVEKMDRLAESTGIYNRRVCDADTICPHFDGDHASQCQKFEQGLHVHFEPTGGASLCSWVKDKMDGDDPDVEAIPQVMCTQLLTQVVSV